MYGIDGDQLTGSANLAHLQTTSGYAVHVRVASTVMIHNLSSDPNEAPVDTVLPHSNCELSTEVSSASACSPAADIRTDAAERLTGAVRPSSLSNVSTFL